MAPWTKATARTAAVRRWAGPGRLPARRCPQDLADHVYAAGAAHIARAMGWSLARLEDVLDGRQPTSSWKLAKIEKNCKILAFGVKKPDIV